MSTGMYVRCDWCRKIENVDKVGLLSNIELPPGWNSINGEHACSEACAIIMLKPSATDEEIRATMPEFKGLVS